jgi:hypothetical protein
MSRRLAILFALASAACAQSLVESGRVDEVRQDFERISGASTLKCDISSVKPALTYGFRFQTGYNLSFPLIQFGGAGHRMQVHVRVTPEGKQPVYFTSAKALPQIPDTKADGVGDGLFVVGEGTYNVDLLMVDEERRFCRSSWQIQAHRTGNERMLAPTTPPLKVEEVDTEQPPASKKPVDIGRLTILLNAAPLHLRRTKFQEEDIAQITETLGAVLRQWPARAVRLIAFSLSQHAVVMDTEKFGLSGIPELADKLEHLELGAIDYRTLASAGKPMDMLADLVQKEVASPQPADAVLIVGPWTGPATEEFAQFEKRTKPSSIFYLEFLGQLAVPIRRGMMPGPAEGRDPFPIGPNGETGPPLAINMVVADSIQKLVARLKGDTLPIRSPHDLAEAIHRIDPRIPRSAPPPGATEPEPVTTPPVAPPAPKPVEPERPPVDDADAIDVLARLRDRVLENGAKIPNHTCVETVDRSRFDHTGETIRSCDAMIASHRKEGTARLRLRTTDRLRLDVALATDREMYSWAGANQFDDREIDEIVPHGAMGTGPFASYLLSVFEGRPPRFVFEGDTTVAGRTVYEYSFNVPKAESHFRFKAHKEWLITAYSGTLFVDPKTSDLVRLVVRTEELPAETETCEVETTLDYGKVRLSGALFFLPSATKQVFLGRDGEESDNIYSFASCRDFGAQSSIRFGEHEGESAHKAADPEAALHWPAGLPVIVELQDSVDSTTAAAGDRIHGKLAQPIRDAQGNTLAAAGTPVAGRLMRVEVRHPSPAQVTIALRWETIELDGRMMPLALAPNRVVKPGAGSNIQAGGIAALPGLVAGLKRRGVEFELPLPGEERYLVYHFAGKQTVVESGLKTAWVTGRP